MRYDRIYTTADGESHFDEIDVELTAVQYAPPAPPISISEAMAAERAIFFEAPSGWVGDFHPTPRRQLYVGLGGELEITASSGESRRFTPGSSLLLEDTQGKGHESRVVGDGDVHGLFVHLE